REGARGAAGSLAAHVVGPAAALRLLARVRAVEDIDATRRLLPSLPEDESAITPDDTRTGSTSSRKARSIASMSPPARPRP
ncbi:hypothetical protein, partial [Pseudofulvimonas gallinarii]|uniref:hypothetical protein n=1 Tax=Pseudofulvimonas gallinarii TaxID=634155 RepID=UPI0013DD87D5